MPTESTDVYDLKRQIERLEKECEGLQQRLSDVERDRVENLQNVSHQIVAPLNAIKWHIENLTETRVSIDRAKKVLRSIYSQATLAAHLAKNFRLMSNLETEHALSALKEPLQEVELCRLLVNLADDFQPLAWDRDIKIVVDDNPFASAPPVLAMRPLIIQVFSNIIENAVKYADSGTTILISGEYVSGSDCVVVRIKDRGISLTEADTKKVSQRGFRTDEAKRKYPAGTGFGLYIARRIIELHEGSITCEMRNLDVVFSVTLSVRGLEGKAR